MVNLLYVDLFCGAGGTSTGIESAKVDGRKCARVLACVNHDANAIASHAANHQDVLHYTEDIRTLNLTDMVRHVASERGKHPTAKLVLWASLECTNFSRAKGGMARDADSRTLADHLFRYVEALNPDFVHIENVEEFMGWGALDENGKPIASKSGSDYNRWIAHMCAYGYAFEYRILNSADFGAYTSRRRFFGQFARHGLPICWPLPTHSKTGEHGIKKWKAVRDVLDFTDEGESIFERKKPLVDATLERIYAGLVRFVAGGRDNWLLKYNSVNGKNGRHVPPSTDEPCPTVACQDRLGLVRTYFLSQYQGGRPETRNTSVDRPCRVVTCANRFTVVKASFMQQRNTGIPASKVFSVDRPARTVTCSGGNQELVQCFLQTYYGNGGCHSIDSAAPCLTTKDRVAACFIQNSYSGGGQLADINNPSPTVMSVPKQNLVTCKPSWLMDTSFSNVGSSLDVPAPVMTANRKWHYLMNPQFSSCGRDINQPCFTLIASMHKRSPYLISAQGAGGDYAAPKAGDTESMRKVREFMRIYGICDIRMRMLKIVELKRIMGFSPDYTLIGTRANQKKFIGNAVEVNMSRVICEATARILVN